MRAAGGQFGEGLASSQSQQFSLVGGTPKALTKDVQNLCHLNQMSAKKDSTTKWVPARDLIVPWSFLNEAGPRFL